MMSATERVERPTLDAPSAGLARQSSVLHALTMSLVLVILFYFFDELTSLTLATVSNIATVCAVVTLAMVMRIFPQRGWSVPAVYLLVFSVFHFGVTAVFGAGLLIETDTIDYLNRWFYTSFTSEAIALCMIGFVACGLGAHLAPLGRARQEQSGLLDSHLNHGISLMGFVLVLASVGSWFVVMFIEGSLSLATGSYAAFLEATADLPLSYVYYGVGLGMSFLAATDRSRLQRVGFVIFLAWALFALPLGLRGEVMFPALAALVVTAKRKLPLSPGRALVLALLVLSLIACIKQLRQVGLQDFEWSQARLSPLDALTELGGTLRPVSEAILWQHAGDGYIHGASYWAPIDRALRRVIPGLSAPDAVDDERLMNVLVRNRVGPIGFSPVAEAYRNFGPAGVVAVMLMLGVLLGKLAMWPATRLHQAMLGVVFVPLLIHIRNAWTPVPFQIISGFGILFSAVLLGSIAGKVGHKRSYNTKVYEPLNRD